jgi:hypothetical protein
MTTESTVVPVEAAEYLYERALFEDLNGHLDWEVRQYPIVKRTTMRVYYADRSGRVGIVDRQKLESEGSVWVRSGGGFTLHANRVDAEPTSAETTTEKVTRLRVAMAAVHPDRGGDPAEFRAAFALYEKASARQKAQG